MASKWLRDTPFQSGSAIDITNNFLNIDKLCDVLVTTQKSNGESTSFRQKTFDDDEEPQKPKTSKEHECHGCGKSCQKEDDPTRNRFIGLLESDDYDDDDEDDFYLCEYCDALGYRQKYDASRCDMCSVCESCAEYEEGECSGCSYSIYRDGSYYRDRINADELMESDDTKIFKELESGSVSEERLERSRFSLLD